MVKSIKSNFRKNRNTKGSIGKRARASKINASTLYETCSEQLSPFGGLLAVIKFLDLLGFEQLFHSAYQAPARNPKLGHYKMVVGILMLLFIGFNRIWHFTYIRLDAMLCGFFRLTQLPVASTFWRYVDHMGINQGLIRSGPLINIDETTLQVLNEPGRANTTKSYMWVFCGGTPEHPAVLFDYHPTRSGQVALAFLDDYRGFIQSDGFIGYDYLGRKRYIVLLACWSHARRKFVEVVKARKKVRGCEQSPKGLADEALEFIGQLYLIEKQCRQAQMSAAG
jgi:hypothetical protein